MEETCVVDSTQPDTEAEQAKNQPTNPLLRPGSMGK